MQSSDKYNERVEAVLGRSRRAEALVAAGAISTAVLVGWLPLALEGQALLLAWIGASALHALRRLRPGVRLHVTCEGAIEVAGRAGTVRDGSFVAPWLTIIRWRPAGAWWDRCLLVAPGMIDAEDARRLRVLLRFGDRPLSLLSSRLERTKGTDPGRVHAS